jgi:ribosomal protein L21E
MITVKCYYENGDTVTTGINATFKQAESYFVGKVFNIGAVEDNLQKCTKIELA